MKKRVAVLGSTGAVGSSTLQVARHLKEEVEIVALAAKSNIALLEAQALEFSPQLIAVYDLDAARALQHRLPHIPVLGGVEGLKAAAELSAVDFVMLAMAGSIGLLPAVAAIEAGKEIGLANKEILICAGEWIARLAKERSAKILPVDSELSALFQCLQGEEKRAVRRLILTASGGALREKSEEELERVTVEEALGRPNWKMGPKAAIDTTTLINKGFEMIEARWLFDIEPDRIEAVIHPQSRIHSCVEFVDGAVMALMAEPDMVLPIQYAVTYPVRKPGILPKYDFFKNGMLTFHPPDKAKFRGLQLAIDAMRAGKSYPCYLNAANEVLVDRFLKREIPWNGIGIKLEKLISSHQPANVLTLDAILSVDRQAREEARCS